MDKEKIKKILSEKIEENRILIDEKMSKHTSFKIGGNADIFVYVESMEELNHILDIAKKENIPIKMIGNGTNVLVKDNGIRGIVIRLKLDKIEFIDEEKVRVEAGLVNAILAHKLLENELSGFEFAEGIPGTIGGAIRINAGCFAFEMKDIVEEVTFLDIDKSEIKTFDSEECRFNYRESIFSNMNVIILNTILKLKKGNKEDIENLMKEYREKRASSQPLEYSSAGSTFKRGEGFITAKLIDECNLKGSKIGGAEVSTKHAGFIVNKGNATAEDVINLAEYVKKQVKEKTGKDINLEIEVIGE